MIIVRLLCGLGNQLFQYAIGRRLALINKLPLKLDTTFYQFQNLRAFKLHHFNIKADIATEQEINQFFLRDRKLIEKIILFQVEKILPTRYKRKYIEEKESFIYNQNILKIKSKAYINGFWQNYKYYEDMNEILFEDLTLKQDYSSITKYYLEEINATENTASLHIRRGDYISNSWAKNKFGTLPINYYVSAIDYLKKKIGPFRAFIFSDDLAWVKKNINFDIECKYVEIGNPEYDFLELYLMSKCKHNIIANSTFSWWGAYLNQNQNKIVISPRRWSSIPKLNKNIEIQFPEWIKI